MAPGTARVSKTQEVLKDGSTKYGITNGMIASMAEKRKYETDTLCGYSS